MYDRNTNLTILLRGATGVLPLWLQLILLFLAGFFSYEPPIWMNFDKALKVMGCRAPDPTNSPPATRKEVFWLWMRLIFYTLMFLVDFADAIVDFWVSIQETLGLASCDNDNPPALLGYAILYFLGTAVGRTLGGLLALFYHRIDESDRELTYLLVELMILSVEDGAAILFLRAKRDYGITWTQLDYVSATLTAVCFLVFLVPTMCHLHDIKEALPRWRDWAGLVCFLLSFLFVVIGGLSLQNLNQSNAVLKAIKAIMLILYLVTVLSQLHTMYKWVRHLKKKEKARGQQQWQLFLSQMQEPRDLERGEDPIPMAGGGPPALSLPPPPPPGQS